MFDSGEDSLVGGVNQISWPDLCPEPENVRHWDAPFLRLPQVPGGPLPSFMPPSALPWKDRIANPKMAFRVVNPGSG